MLQVLNALVLMLKRESAVSVGRRLLTPSHFLFWDH